MDGIHELYCCRLLVLSKLPLTRSLIRITANQAMAVCRYIKTSFIPSGFWNRLVARVRVIVSPMPPTDADDTDSVRQLRRRQSQSLLDSEPK